MNDPMEETRRQYARQMLGQGRPRNASKRVAKMVDGLIQAQRWELERPEARGHWAAQVKDRRKALLRYVGQMEHDDEERAVMDEIITEARKMIAHDECGTLQYALQRLDEIRARKEEG